MGEEAGEEICVHAFCALNVEDLVRVGGGEGGGDVREVHHGESVFRNGP